MRWSGLCLCDLATHGLDHLETGCDRHCSSQPGTRVQQALCHTCTCAKCEDAQHPTITAQSLWLARRWRSDRLNRLSTFQCLRSPSLPPSVELSPCLLDRRKGQVEQERIGSDLAQCRCEGDGLRNESDWSVFVSRWVQQTAARTVANAGEESFCAAIDCMPIEKEVRTMIGGQ